VYLETSALLRSRSDVEQTLTARQGTTTFDLDGVELILVLDGADLSIRQDHTEVAEVVGTGDSYLLHHRRHARRWLAEVRLMFNGATGIDHEPSDASPKDIPCLGQILALRMAPPESRP